MIRRNIITLLLSIASNAVSFADVRKDYCEASKFITQKVLEKEDLLAFSKTFCVEDVKSFFENMILASYALSFKDKNLLNISLNNFTPLFGKTTLLKNCFNSFCVLFSHRKYPQHLALASIRSHSNELRIFIHLCKEMMKSCMLSNLPKNITTIIENYQKDIKFSKDFGLETAYDKQIKALVK